MKIELFFYLLQCSRCKNSLILRFKARIKSTNIYIYLVNVTNIQYNLRKEYEI